MGNWGKKIAGFIVLGIAGVLLVTYLFMVLWNMLIPEIFNGPTLTYFQAIGLMVLAKMLFGFGGNGWGSKQHWGAKFEHNQDKRSAWKEKIEAKMASMSDEEKEKFKNSMKGWCYGKKTESQTDESNTEPKENY